MRAGLIASRRYGEWATYLERSGRRRGRGSTRKDIQWQRTRFASGTTRTPRPPLAFMPRPFPDTAVGAIHRAPGDYPSGKKGDVLVVEFKVAGVSCIGLNGGPQFKHNEAFSFVIATDDQAETDRYWNAIVGNGGEESACGWCKDKWGVNWQITPGGADAGDHRSLLLCGKVRVRGDDDDVVRSTSPRSRRGAAAKFRPCRAWANCLRTGETVGCPCSAARNTQPDG